MLPMAIQQDVLVAVGPGAAGTTLQLGNVDPAFPPRCDPWRGGGVAVGCG